MGVSIGEGQNNKIIKKVSNSNEVEAVFALLIFYFTFLCKILFKTHLLSSILKNSSLGDPKTNDVLQYNQNLKCIPKKLQLSKSTS